MTTLAPPADRGRLLIHPAVLRKLVEQAADRTPGTLRRERRIGTGGVGATARVAAVAGEPDTVDVRLQLTLRYPAPVGEVVTAVRAAVAGELDRVAGHRLRALAVTVTGLRGAPDAPRLH